MTYTRKMTCHLLDLVDEGMVDKDWLILALLSWMSEDDVAEFCERNEIGQDEEEDEEEDDPNSVASKEHY